MDQALSVGAQRLCDRLRGVLDGVRPAVSAFHATWLFIAACSVLAGLKRAASLTGLRHRCPVRLKKRREPRVRLFVTVRVTHG